MIFVSQLFFSSVFVPFTASNACTLIAVLQACNIELTDHRIRYFGEPPEEHKGTVALFMATMGEANRIHLDMLRAGTLDENRLNITIPEACGVVQPNQKILSELVKERVRKQNKNVVF